MRSKAQEMAVTLVAEDDLQIENIGIRWIAKGGI